MKNAFKLLRCLTVILCFLSVPAMAQKPELVVQGGHSSAVPSVAFSPGGKVLASGSVDHTIKLWDAATGRELGAFSGHSGSVISVTLSPDGKE